MPGQVEAGHRRRDRRRRPHLRGRARRASRRGRRPARRPTCSSARCAARSATPISAVASGCDFVVAQGTEAGGHTGTVATMALVPQVVDAVGEQVPVVAAGGLFDGRGLAAALCPRRRRRVGRHPVHRHARGARGQRLQGDAGRHRRGRHGDLARLHRQDRAGSCATSGPDTSRTTPTSSQPFPQQAIACRRTPAPTTSGTPTAPTSTSTREFMPAGQGVGAIDCARPGRRARAPDGRRGRGALARVDASADWSRR